MYYIIKAIHTSEILISESMTWISKSITYYLLKYYS